MDPQISLNVQPDFTEEEKARFKAAEEEIEAQKKAKIEREKEANDPLAMLALQMKRKKGNEPVEEVKQEEFDIEGAESKLAKAKNLYKSLTCIEFSGNAPVVVVGSADGTVSCYRVKGLDILPLSDQEQLSRLEGSMFDALSMNDDGGH